MQSIEKMLEIIPVKMFMTGAQSNKHEHCSNCRYAKSLSKNKPKKGVHENQGYDIEI